MQTKSLQTKRALRTTLLVLLLSLAGMGKGYAYDFSAVCPTGQTLYYNIIDNTHHYVEVISPHGGDVPAFTGALIIPSSVTYDGTTYSVKTIGEGTFEYCTGLTSVEIPNSVTSIGSNAFSSCRGLTLFSIPNSVTTIGQFAFNGCRGLTSVTIPSSVTSIGYNAFEECSGLTKVNITDLAAWCEINFEGYYQSDYCATNPLYYAHHLYLNESEITQLSIPNSVTSIGDYAFSDCYYLTSVEIPNSVTKIGQFAFNGCRGLTSVTIPSSVTSTGYKSFAGCTGLTKVIITDLAAWCRINFGYPHPGINPFSSNPLFYAHHLYLNESEITQLSIPNSVTSIESWAFCGCTGFTGSLTIPNSVTTIGTGAFFNCSGFTGSLTIPNSVTSIGGSAFSGCTGFTGSLTISNSVTSIEYGAFSDCTGLTSVTIPNSVTSIGENAFEACTSLTSVTISNSVTSIGNSAFSDCTGLTSVTIPNSVTSIEFGAFYGCTGLRELCYEATNTKLWNKWLDDCSDLTLTIGNSLTFINDDLFYECPFLTSVIIGDSVTSIGYRAFSQCHGLASVTIGKSVTIIDDEAFSGCDALTTVSIGNAVTSIGDEAFAGCSGLISVIMPDSVTSIRNKAFSGCTSLTSITIPNSVTIIGAEAFSGCTNMTSATIGKSVTIIEEEVFSGCSRLTMVYYDAESACGDDIFTDAPNLTTIYIGANVKEICSDIFNGCNTVHFVVALGPTPAVLDAGAFSDIVDNSVLMVSCGKRVTYYSVWNMFPFNNIIEDCDTYGINVGAVGNGGTVTPSVTEAQMGQEVQITITPYPGMALVSIKVVNANDPTQIIPISPTGKAASIYSFTMPPFEVVVMATFTTANTSVEENTSVSVPASVYPNPTTGYVKVEAENIKQISISNMLGQVVFDSKVGDDAFEYDFSGQKAGIYLVRIETANGVVVKKISVTR